MEEIKEKIEYLSENEGEMTEQEVFDAYAEILMSEDIDWDIFESLGLYNIPHCFDENEYGRTEEKYYFDKGRLTNYYQNFFTKEHQMNLMSLYKEVMDNFEGRDDY